MKNYIEGYKAFEHDFCNEHGVKFDVGQNYHIDGPVKSGISGCGFHISVCPEFTFRFVNSDPEPILCEVIGYGKISDEGGDEYFGEYDIYACSDIYIKRIVPRVEIIEMAKGLCEYKLERFLSTYKITDEEAEIIEGTFKRYDFMKKKHIDYYHYGQKDVYY